MNRFVIIGNEGLATNFLRRHLVKIEGVLMEKNLYAGDSLLQYTELFSENRIFDIENDYKNLFYSKRGKLNVDIVRLYKNRYADPYAFFDFLNQRKDVELYGFQILSRSFKKGTLLNPNFTKEFLRCLKKHKYKIVLNNIDNYFELEFISQYLDQKEKKIKFDIEGYLEKVKNHEEFKNNILTLCKELNLKVHITDYSKLSKSQDNEEFINIVRFITGKRNTEVTVDPQKNMNKILLQDCIKNLLEVKKALRKDPYFKNNKKGEIFIPHYLNVSELKNKKTKVLV